MGELSGVSVPPAEYQRIGNLPVDLRKLAHELGLSTSTVSRALNGYHDVKEETRKRVFEAAETFGYEASAVARRLRSNKAEAIGVILTPPQSQFADPFFLELLTGIDEALTGTPYHLLVTAARNKMDELDRIRRLVRGRRVDGLIFARTEADDRRIALLQQQGTPFATIGRSNATEPFVSIDIDHTVVGYDAVKRLAGFGHRRIGLINTPGHLMYSRHCRQGYDQAHRDLGLTVDPDLLTEVSMGQDGGRRGVERLMAVDRPPTALICGNDVLAIGAMAALQQRGLTVGRDVAVIGCDDQPLTQFTSPALTTFSAPVRRAGEHLAQLLLRIIDGEPPDGMQEVWRPELVVRASDGGVRDDLHD